LNALLAGTNGSGGDGFAGESQSELADLASNAASFIGGAIKRKVKNVFTPLARKHKIH